jgi:DNA invertase Pin-like site-specific DNA recombinase
MDRKIAKVAVYVRKSRPDETDDVLNRQKDVLLDLCKRNQWEYELFIEVGSSQDLDREELQNMLNKVKLFHFDAVVSSDQDRLSRNVVHFGLIKEVFINAGCLFVTPSKVFNFAEDSDSFMSDIFSVMAKQEYSQIKKRLVRGSRQSAKQGNWLGKKNPIGYKYNRETKRLELSEDAPIIKRMFQEYIDGLSTTAIADKFTLEGVNTSVGMLWSSAGVSRLLNNRVYCGDSLFGKTKVTNGKRDVKTSKEEWILVENTHEPIVDKEMWEKVQRIKLQRNSRPIALKVGKHKFSGLIQCAICSNIHSFQNSRGKRKRINSCQTRHYVDNSFDKYTVCPNKSANIDEFEQLFFLYFGQYIEQFEKHIDMIKASEKPSQDSSVNKINTFERQLKRLDQDIKRVQQGFQMEIYTAEDAQVQIKGFRAQKESVEKELERLKNTANNSSTDYLEKVLKRMKELHAGRDVLPEGIFNEKLRGIVDVIIYKKLGGQNAEMELKVIWKQ